MDAKIATPRIVVAGVSSGVGKTTTTVAILGALRARGMRVVALKCGPDYLDPTYHARVCGRSHNLDGWMMGQEAVMSTFARVARDVDFAVIEGVMGLFDGASPQSEEGSTAQIAKWLQAPIILVIDASGMARTIAAIAKGFAEFDPELRILGVVANHVGSRGHLDLLRSVPSPVPVVGGLPRAEKYSFPERHLGLVSANVSSLADELFVGWAQLAQDWIDLDAVIDIGRSAPPIKLNLDPEPKSLRSWPRCRIAVAFDEAFHFYYEDNLRRLELCGAQLIHFSPLHDRALPHDVDGIYLGGGYPETVAQKLSENDSMLESIRNFAREGGPIYAECGGLMYLSQGIRTVEGDYFPMVGIISGDAVMADKLQALGYAEVETIRHTVLGPPGLRFRGHQFRYSSLSAQPGENQYAYRVSSRRKKLSFEEGYVHGNVLASYIHAHFASNPNLAEGFVTTCEAHRARRRRDAARL